MYCLIVSNDISDLDDTSFDFARSRFLEYTNASIATQLEALSVEALDCLRSWPCILMQEGRGGESAYVGQITDLVLVGDHLRVTVERLPTVSPILNADLWRLRAELDIEQFEFSRYHWSIKDRDLVTILHSNGRCIEASAATHFGNKPLPAPSRSDLLSAGRTIGRWGHTEIDDFLLEAGVPGLSAERLLGSRRDRANAILSFALEHPAATTAENSLFSAFIFRKVHAQNRTSSTNDAALDLVMAEVVPILEAVEAEAHSRSPNRVFIVHGQNDSARIAVTSFLRDIGLEGIVLHDQPNMGRHLLTKFIEEAELVTFAVVLMTDDDVGARTGSALAARARQNVILELGFFLSHLGQARVCALITPGLETPSDFDGIVYISMDDAARWQAELQRELQAAGMPLSELG